MGAAFVAGVVGFLSPGVVALLPRIRRCDHAIEVVSGMLTIGIGILVFTNRFTVIAQWLTPYLPTF